MTAFDQVQQASFAGYVFPWSRIRVSCSLRDHVHYYPHAPGGQPEKLGRNLYDFHFTCPFHGTLPAYPKLWPETLASLRIIFEGGGTFDLVVPTIGTIQAYCVKWDEDADAKKRSGVTTEFTFREDSSELFLVTEMIAARTSATTSARKSLQQAVSDSGIPDDDGFLSKLTAAVQDLERMKGRAEQEALTIAYKAESVMALCDRAASLPVFDDPPFFFVLDAVREVQATARLLAVDAGKSKPLTDYLVTGPFPQPVGAIARRLYGSSDRALEIMRLNPLPDPLAVLPGTMLRVYAPDVAQTA